jgi:hypothetical protein
MRQLLRYAGEGLVVWLFLSACLGSWWEWKHNR